MLTVAELALACRTSTTTIYRTLKDVQRNNTQRSTHLTEKRKGITHFTEEGERIIKERLNTVEQNANETSIELNNVEHVEQAKNDEILFLRKQNETLLQELSKQREEASKERDEIRKEREQNQLLLEKEREHSRQQAERLAELSDKLTELTKNEQILTLKNKNTLLLPDGRQPDISAEPSDTQENNKTGSFLRNIFKSKKNRQ